VIAPRNSGPRRIRRSGVLEEAIRRERTPFKTVPPFLLRALNTGILVSPAKTGFPAQTLDALSVAGEEDAYN